MGSKNCVGRHGHNNGRWLVAAVTIEQLRQLWSSCCDKISSSKRIAPCLVQRPIPGHVGFVIVISIDGETRIDLPSQMFRKRPIPCVGTSDDPIRRESESLFTKGVSQAKRAEEAEVMADPFHSIKCLAL